MRSSFLLSLLLVGCSHHRKIHVPVAPLCAPQFLSAEIGGKWYDWKAVLGDDGKCWLVETGEKK